MPLTKADSRYQLPLFQSRVPDSVVHSAQSSPGSGPGPVRVAEQHVLGVGRQRVRHPAHRQQPGAAQLLAAQRRR